MAKIIRLALLLLLFRSSLLSQAPVGVSAVLEGGALVPQSTDLKGSVTNTREYPLSDIGYVYGGKLRLAGLALPVRFVGSIQYNHLSGGGDITIVGGPSGPVTTSYELTLAALSYSVGVEYPFASLQVLSPYLSAEFGLTHFTGSGHDNHSVFPSATLNPANRYSVAFGVGTDIAIPGFPVSLELDGKYRAANLIGRQFGSNPLGISGFGWIPQQASYDLNDARNPNDASDQGRSIDYFILMVGVSFRIL